MNLLLHSCWTIATGVVLPSATTALTAPAILNRAPHALLLRMNKSDDSGGGSGSNGIDYGRDFPRRHGFSRVVVPHTTDLDVDLAAVDTLLNERGLARENKDFRAADNILNRLLVRHGVILNDTDRTWQTGTKKEVKKRRKQLTVVAPAPASRPDGSGRGRGSNHDYTLSPAAGPHSSILSEEEVHATIADRRRAQRDRDYKEADRLRHRLKKAGVYLDDGAQEWRADGFPFPQRVRDDAPPPFALARSAHSLPLRGDDDARVVDGLLAERTRLRSGGEYARADAVRDRLFETYDIRLDDRLGEWSAGGNFGAARNSHWAEDGGASRVRYAKSATSAALPAGEDEGDVQARVDERMRAKRTRNYALADEIRDDLYRRLDVTIHDKINEWSVGGDFGDESWNHVDPAVQTGSSVEESRGDVGMNAAPSFNADRDSREQRGGGISPNEEHAGSDVVLSQEQLERLTVIQLKEILRKSGAKVSGTKAKLIKRLLS